MIKYQWVDFSQKNRCLNKFLVVFLFECVCDYIFFPDADEVPAKKRKEEENKEEILEMMENSDNPLRCPVRLYEFYLSKW